MSSYHEKKHEKKLGDKTQNTRDYVHYEQARNLRQGQTAVFHLCPCSVQFSRLVVSDSVTPGWQHARLPCPSPTPQACSNSCPSSQWYHPTISSSVFWTLLDFTLVYWTLLCAKYWNILLQLFLTGVLTQIVLCHRGSKRPVWKLNPHLFDAKVLTHILFYFFNLHPVSLVV